MIQEGFFNILEDVDILLVCTEESPFVNQANFVLCIFSLVKTIFSKWILIYLGLRIFWGIF